jgi:hypothetical protein
MVSLDVLQGDWIEILRITFGISYQLFSPNTFLDAHSGKPSNPPFGAQKSPDRNYCKGFFVFASARESVLAQFTPAF